MALMTGIMLPVMVMSLAMGIEITSWSVAQQHLQQIADVSAWAGAARYAASPDAQGATNAAADLAQINGIVGAQARTWNAATSTTTDNQITAQMVSGVKSASAVAVQVTVRRTISKSFSKIFPSATSFVTVSATAVAELAGGGPQPCLVALKGVSTGSTAGAGITLTGSGQVTTHSCSVRSNAGISMTGSASLDVASVYAGGAITTTGSASITGQKFANAGQIPDPYATYAPLQNAFASLSSGGSSQNIVGSTTATLNPGTYSKISVGGSAKVTLNPGLYVVNGDVSFTGSAIVNGHGVTIISSGTLTATGSTSISLTAPTKAAASGVPGILFASKSASSTSFTGSASLPFAGVIYTPNGSVTFTGSADNGSAGCTEVIADTIRLTGSSDLRAECAAYGTVDFGSLASSSVSLVK